MKKIGIYYGSSTGTTAKVAKKIGEKLGISPNDIHDVEKATPSSLGEYEVILLGSSTWGAGELQRDWFDFADALKSLSLKDKAIGVFGCGNEKMKNTFCNAVGTIYDIASETGAKMIGNYDAEGFEFKKSKARFDDSDMMKGLVLDEVNHGDWTDKRIDAWVEKLKGEV